MCRKKVSLPSRQMPPKRDEAALQEEEELQLAIALSQSEAEEKERMVCETAAAMNKICLFLDMSSSIPACLLTEAEELLLHVSQS